MVSRCFLLLAVLVAAAHGTELTFDMEPHEKQCFMEHVNKDVDVTVEYQVVYGGRLDVDMEVSFETNVIHEEKGQQSGAFTFKAENGGEYKFCFSNEMSTLAHKTIYIDVFTGEEQPILSSLKDHHVALTQMETSLASIHASLRTITDFQTHHRMREATHRKTAEYMNERVQWVSTGEMLLLVVLSLFQIIYLRGLFSEKK